MHDHLEKYRELYKNSCFCTICANRIKKNNKKKILDCCKQEVCSSCITKYQNCPFCKTSIYKSIESDTVIEIYDDLRKENLYILKKNINELSENDICIGLE